MEKQLIIITTEAELDKSLSRFASKILEKQKKETEFGKRLTRREAAKFLDVSYQTMHNYVKQGILKEHGTKGKKFFFRDELMEAIKNNNL